MISFASVGRAEVVDGRLVVDDVGHHVNSVEGVDCVEVEVCHHCVVDIDVVAPGIHDGHVVVS